MSAQGVWRCESCGLERGGAGGNLGHKRPSKGPFGEPLWKWCHGAMRWIPSDESARAAS